MTDLPIAPGSLDPGELKCRCAELWSHPFVRLLVGDTFRPGGLALTTTMLDRLALPAGTTVLDVGSGAGATLRLLRQRGLNGVGVDHSATLAAEASAQAPVVVGDAERLPFATACFDAVLVECVLSALPDKPAGLDAFGRVLRPGGRLALTDMTQDGPLPEPLSSLVAWIACTTGALPADGYPRLLADHGFTVEHVEDRSDDLRALVAKARRRFALLTGAVGTGILDGLDATLLPAGDELPTDDPHAMLQAGRDTLAQLAAAVETGELGYVAIVASARGRA